MNQEIIYIAEKSHFFKLISVILNIKKIAN